MSTIPALPNTWAVIRNKATGEMVKQLRVHAWVAVHVGEYPVPFAFDPVTGDLRPVTLASIPKGHTLDVVVSKTSPREVDRLNALFESANGRHS